MLACPSCPEAHVILVGALCHINPFSQCVPPALDAKIHSGDFFPFKRVGFLTLLFHHCEAMWFPRPWITQEILENRGRATGREHRPHRRERPRPHAFGCIGQDIRPAVDKCHALRWWDRNVPPAVSVLPDSLPTCTPSAWRGGGG